MNRRSAIILALVIFSIIVISGCTQSSTTGQATEGGIFEKPTTTVQCRTVYETQEVEVPYTVQEPYQDTEYYQTPLQYQVVSWTAPQEQLSGLNVIQTAEVNLRNTDIEDGWYTVTYTFRTLNDQYPVTKQEYIVVGETKKITFQADLKYGEDSSGSYTVTPAEVTKSRIVTKYKDVTKYRTETRTSTKQVCE